MSGDRAHGVRGLSGRGGQSSLPRRRACTQTPHKVKFFTVDDAQRHIERTSRAGALGAVRPRPRRPYHCPACGWVHVSTIRGRRTQAAGKPGGDRA